MNSSSNLKRSLQPTMCFIQLLFYRYPSRLIPNPIFSISVLLLHHHNHNHNHNHPLSAKPPPSHPTTKSTTTLSNLLQGHIPRSRLLKIHALVFRLNAHQDNLVATRLIGHYPSRFALRIFNLLHSPNLFPFNAIIRVLAEEGVYSTAFSIFKQLNSFRSVSLSPNDLTFSFLLKGCLRAKDVSCVKQIHTHVVKLGYLDNSFVCNGLLVVYAKGFQDLVSARKVFEDMPEKRMVGCWTSLISGFAKVGDSEQGLQLFISMAKENLRPNDDTMVSVLSACSNLQIVKTDKWVRIFSHLLHEIDSENMCRDSFNTVLVYLYGKCGMVDKSRESFDKVGEDGKTSVLSWNAMIGTYVQNGFPTEALDLFRQMMEVHNCNPNHVTMVSVLSACAQIGDLDLGMWIHEYLRSKGRNSLLSSNKNIATALIDMYVKCGSLQRARDVFKGMVTKDVVSYNAMIMGLAMNSEEEEALRLFSEMQEIGLNPNGGTFLGVLCACCHAGLLEKGRKIFADMSSKFLVQPKLEHYACYVDLIARVGNIEEALQVASSMPFAPNAFVLGALLAGCQLHNRTELAKDVSKVLVQMDPENSAGYVILSNAFATDRKWGDVSGLRSVMREKGVRKQPGCSWIKVHGVVHKFLAGYHSHPEDGRIYDMLNTLLKEMKLGNSSGIC